MLLLSSILVVTLAAAPAPAFPSHWNGGRNVPVHRLVPLDSDGDRVSPADPRACPVSAVRTCGQCHDVDAMKGGSHFRTGLDTNEAPVSVRTEPWFWIDPATGSQIPLSLHGQDGAFAPADLGLTAWQWTKMFGRHFPGGGAGSDPRCTSERAGARQRWFVTGPLEANCFACHSRDADYDSSEWVRQVMRENFRGAATAALGLADVQGMNAHLDAAWDPARGPNLDDHVFEVPEHAVYDASKFDAKGRVVFHVGKPTNERCLACHSAAERGMPSHEISGDVHLRAGLKCVDCHQNGIDHRMTTKTCVECHIGTKDVKPVGPRPNHAGFPLVHFQKLACTVCHSGVTHGGALAQVRTSRANRIGVYGRAQWATEAPYILEPVFMTNAVGVIEPRRMMWPAYFGFATNGAVAPLAPDDPRLIAAFAATDRGPAFDEPPVTTGQIARVLARLGGGFVYAANGLAFSLDSASNLQFQVSGAQRDFVPVSWPVAHDVRPARQALGAAPGKCADCHTADSKFFFGKVSATGPVTDVPAATLDRAQLLGIAAPYHRLFGFTFVLRPVFKFFLWTVFALVCLFVVGATAALTCGVSGKGGSISAPLRLCVNLLLCAAAAYLAVSGILGWIFGGMTSWWLVLHMVAGGAFAFALVLFVVLPSSPAPHSTFDIQYSIFNIIFLVFAAAVLFTAVMPMMSVFGSVGQQFLLDAHRVSALGFILAAAVLCLVRLHGRK